MIKKGIKVKILTGKDKNKDGDVIEIPVTYSGHHNGATSQASNGHGPVTIKMHIDNGPAHTHGKITYTPNGFDYTGSGCDYYFYKLIDV